MNELEQFFFDYKYTIAAVGALSTLAAVITSLVIAFWHRRADKPKISAYVDTSRIVHSGQRIEDCPQYLTVDITNIGKMSLRLGFSFFRLKAPFFSKLWLVNPLDYYNVDILIPQKKYPVSIEPRHSESFFISDIESFRQNIRDISQHLNKFQRYFLYVEIRTDDGSIFKAKISDNLRKEIRSLGEEASDDN